MCSIHFDPKNTNTPSSLPHLLPCCWSITGIVHQQRSIPTVPTDIAKQIPSLGLGFGHWMGSLVEWTRIALTTITAHCSDGWMDNSLTVSQSMLQRDVYIRMAWNNPPPQDQRYWKNCVCQYEQAGSPKRLIVCCEAVYCVPPKDWNVFIVVHL